MTVRYSILQKRFSKLGYEVSGEIYNAADYGVPQQRRRAWVLCISRDQLQGTSQMLLQDMQLFRRPYSSLRDCIDLANKTTSSDTKGNKTHDKEDAKWLKGFEEQCDIYGKVTLPKISECTYFIISTFIFPPNHHGPMCAPSPVCPFQGQAECSHSCTHSTCLLLQSQRGGNSGLCNGRSSDQPSH